MILFNNGSESIIKSSIPAYSYGSRREDPTKRHQLKRLLRGTRNRYEGRFDWKMPKDDIIVAWKSHATLKRQAGSDALFDSIIADRELFGRVAGSNRSAVHDSDLLRARRSVDGRLRTGHLRNVSSFASVQDTSGCFPCRQASGGIRRPKISRKLYEAGSHYPAGIDRTGIWRAP